MDQVSSTSPSYLESGILPLTPGELAQASRRMNAGSFGLLALSLFNSPISSQQGLIKTEGEGEEGREGEGEGFLKHNKLPCCVALLFDLV